MAGLITRNERINSPRPRRCMLVDPSPPPDLLLPLPPPPQSGVSVFVHTDATSKTGRRQESPQRVKARLALRPTPEPWPSFPSSPANVSTAGSSAPRQYELLAAPRIASSSHCFSFLCSAVGLFRLIGRTSTRGGTWVPWPRTNG